MERSPAAGPIRLTILHTNDMHGHIEAMPRLSHLARRLRAEAEAQGRLVYLWDAGDAADRRLRLVSLTKGAAFQPILNAMGYALQTMGNDISLTYGPQAIAPVAARSAFPILAANCRDGDGPLVEGLRETALVPLAGGLTMGVVGLTAPWQGLYEVFGLHLPDFCDLARRLVAGLRAQGAAPVAVLSHLGLDDDRRLAEEVPGIDLIVGGHSHALLEAGVEQAGVLIAQAGQYAQALGRVDLDLDRAGGRVLARSAQALAVPEDEPEDAAVLAAIAAAEEEAAAIEAQEIGLLLGPLGLDHFHECGIGSLAADALLEHMGGEVAIVSSGLFHQGLAAGPVTLGRLDAACFTTANPYLTVVHGEQLLAALERGLDPARAEAQARGLRGNPLGIPQVAGMVVEHDPAAAVGRKVRRVTVQGREVTADGLYRLAHTDAETMDDGYLQLDAGQPTRGDVSVILREVIEAYLRAHSPVAVPPAGRWRVVS